LNGRDDGTDRLSGPTDWIVCYVPVRSIDRLESDNAMAFIDFQLQVVSHLCAVLQQCPLFVGLFGSLLYDVFDMLVHYCDSSTHIVRSCAVNSFQEVFKTCSFDGLIARTQLVTRYDQTVQSLMNVVDLSESLRRLLAYGCVMEEDMSVIFRGAGQIYMRKHLLPLMSVRGATGRVNKGLDVASGAKVADHRYYAFPGGGAVGTSDRGRWLTFTRPVSVYDKDEEKAIRRLCVMLGRYGKKGAGKGATSN